MCIQISNFTMQDSELLYEVEVAGPPLCITMNGPDGGVSSLVVGVVNRFGLLPPSLLP